MCEDSGVPASTDHVIGPVRRCAGVHCVECGHQVARGVNEYVSSAAYVGSRRRVLTDTASNPSSDQPTPNGDVAGVESNRSVSAGPNPFLPDDSRSGTVTVAWPVSWSTATS
jgi:hypothetical protein